MITAVEANEMATITYNKNVTEELDRIGEEIERRAERGQFYLTTGIIYQQVKQVLEELGYLVIVSKDLSNNVITEINWRNV